MLLLLLLLPFCLFFTDFPFFARFLYSTLHHIMPTVCSALHSAPTIDLLIIAAFFILNSFWFFFGWLTLLGFWFLARANDHHFETHGHINTECAVHPLFPIFHWLSSQSNTFWRKKILSILSPYSFTPSPETSARDEHWCLFRPACSLSNDNENNHIENSSNHHILLLQPGEMSRSTFTLVAIRFFLSSFWNLDSVVVFHAFAHFISSIFYPMSLYSSPLFHFALICVFLSILLFTLFLSLASLSHGSQIFMAPKTNDDYL